MTSKSHTYETKQNSVSDLPELLRDLGANLEGKIKRVDYVGLRVEMKTLCENFQKRGLG